jgi:deferrochelatase/peroxidase EfeB
MLRAKPEEQELDRKQTNYNQKQKTIDKSPLRRCSMLSTLDVSNDPPDGKQCEAAKQQWTNPR